MNTRADKAQDSNSQRGLNSVYQKKTGTDTGFHIEDNRQEATAQRVLQAMVDGSPQVEQIRQFQAMADHYSAQLPAEKKENRTGLPNNLKAGIENLSGHSMDDVKVHFNSNKPSQLQAHAYAQGTDIHIASGQERHLPHEAWHVAQQKQGRVKPTMQIKGNVNVNVNVNDDAGLEKEADLMGAKASQFVASQAQPAPKSEPQNNPLEKRAAQLQPELNNHVVKPVQKRDIKLLKEPRDVAGIAMAGDLPIQRVEISLRTGQINLPRIYQNPFEPDQYVVMDYAGPDSGIDYYTEINRMCNVMAIVWASNWGAHGNIGFWGFDEADQMRMAKWAAVDVSIASQSARVSSVLNAGDIGVDNFGAVLTQLDDTDSARGVLASAAHAVAIVIRNGKVVIYDSMEGAVTINESLATFTGNFAGYAGIYGWTSAIINS